MRRADEARADAIAPAVINSAALKPLGLASPAEAVGEVVRAGSKGFAIVGVVPDLHFRSLHRPVRPEIYRLDDAPGQAVSIRYRTSDMRRFLAAIDGMWRRRVPGHAVDREFSTSPRSALARERGQAACSALSQRWLSPSPASG